MRFQRTLLVLLGCVVFPSCGLVSISQPQAGVGVISDIRVVAHDTQRPLSSAVVTMESRRMDTHRAEESPGRIVVNDPDPDRRFGRPILVEKFAGGHWTPRQRPRLSLIKPTAGQQLRVTASAPGYSNLSLHFSPSSCQTPDTFRKHLQNSPQSEYCEISNSGVLTLHLPRDESQTGWAN